jgi:DNA-binding MarR family transcriptional regulator
MNEPRWLDQDQMRAWLAFVTAGPLLDRLLDQQLRRDAGLSHLQYLILVRLSAAPDGALRMTELADSLAATKSGLTYQVEQLEKAGLVCRRSCPHDTRGVLAVLTDDGRRRLEEAAPGHVAAVRELFIDVLTPEQLAAIADGLGEVSRRLAAPAQ